MKASHLFALIAVVTSVSTSAFSQDEITRWRNAAQRARNVVNYINNKVDQVGFGGRAQCHRIEDAQSCTRTPGCNWDSNFDVCGYQNGGGGHHRFGGFESDFASDSNVDSGSEADDIGLENDIAAGISLAVIGAKTKRIYQDIDLAAANYPQQIAYQYRDRACRRIDGTMVGTGALSLLLLVPNENNAPHVLTPQDFSVVINELQLIKRDLCI